MPKETRHYRVYAINARHTGTVRSNEASATTLADGRGALLTPSALVVDEGTSRSYAVELTEAPTATVPYCGRCLEARYHAEAECMLRRHAPVGSALAPPRLDGEFQRAAVRPPAAARQPPAQAVVPPGVRQADGDLRRRGEAVVEGREAVADARGAPNRRPRQLSRPCAERRASIVLTLDLEPFEGFP